LMTATPDSMASIHPSKPPKIARRHAPAASFYAELAAAIAHELRAAIAARGYAVLSVSGGKSPIDLFACLREQQLDWQQVRITLVDERFVPSNHPASNARLVREHLLQGLASAARFIPMVTTLTESPPDSPSMNAEEPDLLAAAASAASALQAAGTADVLVLGLGADGHTASLFPDAPQLPAALDLANTQGCMAITLLHPPANAPYPRITQTLAQILTARRIILPVLGDDKLPVLAEAMHTKTLRLPVSYVLYATRMPEQKDHLTIWQHHTMETP
jgi:6-phosphogluconolactonase